ncbi:ferredoxin [Streptomyces sioyaensis]|uniref:ferredoxin n=1 Tax=Streptomyces sioyaensis TaxID=67364 RepID=UPI0037911020
MKITLAADTGRAGGRRVSFAPEAIDRRDEDAVVPPDAAPTAQREDAVRAAAGCPAAVIEVRA